MDVAIEGLLHLKVLRSPHAHARILEHRPRQGAGGAGRGRGLHLGGRAAPALQHRDARGSPRRPRRHLHPRQRRALRRPARRRGGGRDRGRRGSGCRRSTVDTRSCPPCSTPGAMAPDAPILHDKGGEAQRQHLSSTSTARSAASRPASRRPTSIHERTYSTSRVQHVHLETHGSIAWRGDDGRLHVRTSSQAPFIAQAEALPPVRPAPARSPRVHRARRRRLRRQAGDALRGSVRARAR